MKYILLHDERERSFEVKRLGDGRLEVSENGGPGRIVDVRELPGGALHLLLDGHSHDASVLLDGANATVSLHGERHQWSIFNERELRLLRLDQAGSGHFHPEVHTPMAGKVVAIQTAVGSQVEKGDPLLIIEAMKMENIIRAPQAGEVVSIAVAPGQVVESRALLLTMAPPSAEAHP